MACIADLGRAEYAKRLKGSLVQATKSYTALEGVHRSSLKTKDYFKTDVFAVGCVFYELFYNKKAPWQDTHYIDGSKHTVYKRHTELKHRIKHATKYRRKDLLEKRRSQLSPKKKFECLILRMLHTTAEKRGTASELRHRMQKIFKEQVR